MCFAKAPDAPDPPPVAPEAPRLADPEGAGDLSSERRKRALRSRIGTSARGTTENAATASKTLLGQ